MNKKELRDFIRQQKRAMTVEQIESKSARLGELFAETEVYQKAETVYGYLPYNMFFHSFQIFEKALLS